MYVCICQGITQKDIQNAVEDGASFTQIRKEMGLASQCGSCSQYAKQFIKQTQQELKASSLYEKEQLAYAV